MTDHVKDHKQNEPKQEIDRKWNYHVHGEKISGPVCTKFFMLFSFLLAETHVVLKISVATMPHAFNPYRGPDIFRGCSYICIYHDERI